MTYERWWYWCKKCQKWATVIVAYSHATTPPRCEYCGAELGLKELPPEEVTVNA